MRNIVLSVLGLFALSVVPAAGQGRGASAEQQAAQQADSDALRALIRAAPDLPVERIELKPNVTLEGISSIAVDPQGNLYVIHRPTSADVDPIVVLNPQGNRIRSFGRGMFVI